MKNPMRRLSKPIRLLIGCGLPIVLLGAGCLHAVADLQASMRKMETAMSLYNAVSLGRVATVRIMLDNGADPNSGDGRLVLTEAVANDDKKMIDLLMKRGASPSLALAEAPTVPASKMLLQLGANANAHPDGLDGATPLTEQALRANVDIVRFLLAHGGDVRVRDSDGKTILQRVRYTAGGRTDSQREFADVIALLLKAGAR